MEESKGLLDKLSMEDVEKLKVLMSLVQDDTLNGAVTLRVFMNEYKSLIKDNRSSSYYRSVALSLKHLTDHFGEQRNISSISLKEIETFLTFLQQKVKKGYTVYYRDLKAAFNKAKAWGYVNENYFSVIKLPKKQKVHPAYINTKQLSAICEKISADIVRDVVTFGFYTGMRLNEIVNIKWKHVDLTGRIITVGDKDFMTKGRNQRYIPICDEVYEVLMKNYNKRSEANPPLYYLLRGENKEGFIFCKVNGEPFTGDYFSRAFKSACRAAGIDVSIHFHSLRHSFASNLVQQGVPLYVVKELLGHTSISTTEIYSHLNIDSLREAIKKLDVDNGKSSVNTIKDKEATSGLRLIVTRDQ